MLNRSALFIPANKSKMLQKINDLPADSIIIDLEDAVPLAEKSESRELIKSKIYDIKDKNIFIRINEVNTNLFEADIELIRDILSAKSLKGIMIPKCHSDKTIDIVSSRLKDMEISYNLKHNLKIIPLIEDALGIHQLDSICKDTSRITQLAFGAEDFKSDLNIQDAHNDDALLYARSKLVITSKAMNLDKPLDTVFTDIYNEKAFSTQCNKVKALGFGGKLLIHPNQIKIANEIFAPTIEEVELAKEIISLSKTKQGAFNHRGKMIDKPIIENMKKIMKDYEATLDRED